MKDNEVQVAKAGIPIVLALLFLSIILIIAARFTKGMVLPIFVVLTWLMLLFSIYFFRDPNRKTPDQENAIISPADGKIIVIEETIEQSFFKEKVRKVSIFMSVFSVHVNRIPIDGSVVYFDYQKGKFYPAYKDEAAFQNEQTTIGIENKNIKILFKQIAGIMARRIVCNVREGMSVKKGARFGMIKFGSRVDLFLPLNVQLKIELNQKVTAGETIIGLY
ncbi:MAG: phosphatidylserine decarboxylase family protein [bacterium]|nr:phosphatidylserine decarboxylase family protein [bacterium]